VGGNYRSTADIRTQMITNSASRSYSPTRIRRLFQNLGGSDEATNLREIAHPIAEIPLGRFSSESYILNSLQIQLAEEGPTLANLVSVVQLLGESAGK
jgi:hypothetical protein